MSEWKPLIAVLANPETRRVAAELMLGTGIEAATAGLSPSKRERVTDALVRSGIVDAATGSFAPDVFRTVLNAAPTPKRDGIDRFLKGKRIRQYPAKHDERVELLSWVARDAFAADDVLSERAVNDRLLAYSDDVAALRRYLVDYELVERRSDGSEYALIAPDAAREVTS